MMREWRRSVSFDTSGFVSMLPLFCSSITFDLFKKEVRRGRQEK
jgi:hypothetical protein